MEKQKYLDFYSKVYDEIYKVSDEVDYRCSYLHIFEYLKLCSANSLHNNLNSWIIELNNLIGGINRSLEKAIVYDSVIKKNNCLCSEQFMQDRNLYIMDVVYKLSSYKDKVAYLFSELLGIEVYKVENMQVQYNKPIEYEYLDFKKFNRYLKVIKYEGKEIINKCNLNKDNFELVKKYFNDINNIESRIFEFRNSDSHRWTPGIDSFGSGVLVKRSKRHKNNNEEKLVISPILDNISDEHKFINKINERFLNANKIISISPSSNNMSFESLVYEIKILIEKYNLYLDELQEKYIVND